MAVFKSNLLRLFLDHFDPGTATTSCSISLASQMLDKTSWTDVAETSLAGRRQDSIDWSGYFEDSTLGVDKMLGTIVGTRGGIVSYCIGTGIGSRAYSGTVFASHIKAVSAGKELVKAEMSLVPDQAWHECKLFAAKASQSGTFAETINSGSIDDGGSSTGTTYMYAHMHQVPGTIGTIDIGLADSADGTTFGITTTEVSFTGTGAKIGTLTSNLRRYVRVRQVWTSSTGTMLYSVTYTRNK